MLLPFRTCGSNGKSLKLLELVWSRPAGCAELNPLTPLEVAQLHHRRREFCKEQGWAALGQSSLIPAFCAESYKSSMKSCLRQERRFWRTGRFLLRLPRRCSGGQKSLGCSAQVPGHVQGQAAGGPREFPVPRHHHRVRVEPEGTLSLWKPKKGN